MTIDLAEREGTAKHLDNNFIASGKDHSYYLNSQRLMAARQVAACATCHTENSLVRKYIVPAFLLDGDGSTRFLFSANYVERKVVCHLSFTLLFLINV